MNDKIQGKKTPRGQFFSINLDTFNELAKAGATAEQIAAFLILNRGAHPYEDIFLTAYGAKSISERLPITYRKAEAALRWLASTARPTKMPGYILASPDRPGETRPKNHRGVNTPRWIIESAESMDSVVYLPNALCDGIASENIESPLNNIFCKIETPLGKDAQTKLDTLMVLLHLYYHDDLEGSGGLNPVGGVFVDWVGTENADGESTTELGNSGLTLYEIKREKLFVYGQFAKTALAYIDDETSRNNRFWMAMTNLSKLGLIYEATIIWSRNPTFAGKEPAYPLYTLYIHDDYARSKEPYLQSEIHRLAIDFGVMNGYGEFSDFSISENIVCTGRFRYVAIHPDNHPLGVFRLRFRPHTRDIGIGIDAEFQRNERWKSALSNVFVY